MEPTETKPGYKTTEFWSAIPGAAALIQSAEKFESPWVQGIAVAGAAVCICWYTYSRSMVKAAVAS